MSDVRGLLTGVEHPLARQSRCSPVCERLLPSAMQAGWVVTSACAAIAAFVFSNTLDAGFVYDDNRAILANDDVRWSSPFSSLFLHDFWGTPLTMEGSHKSWRPLTVLSFRLNHWAGGLRPWGFHATNVLLHALATTLFLCWSRSVLPRGPAPVIAALVFAVHPVHCEAVAGLVGRAELGCTVFLLLALLSHGAHVQARDTCRPRQAATLLALTVVLAASASLCKEQGLVTLVLCVACDVICCAKPTDILRSPKLQTMRSSICTLASASLGFFAVRLTVMGGKLPKFVLADNPAAHSEYFITRLLTFLYLPVFNFGLFLCPSTLSFDWSMDSIPLIESWTDSRNFLSVIFYTVLGVMVWRYGRPLLMGDKGAPRDVILGVVMAAVPFLPASNLLGYVGFVVAERVLYAPSLGLSLLLGAGASRLWRRPRTPRVLLACLMALMLASLAAKTWRRNADWRCEEALYRSGVAVNPAKAYGNLGSVLSSAGRVREAETCYRRALLHRPNMADVHYNLGLLLLQSERRQDEAVRSLRTAIACRPRLAAAHVSLGVALGRLGRGPEALAVLRHAAHLDGTGLRDPRAHESARASAFFHLGRLQLEQGRPEEALEAFLRAKDAMPASFQPQSVYNLLGEAYSRLGRPELAEPWIRASLAARPDHLPAHLSYAKLLTANKSRAHEAEGWYRRAMHLAPSEPAVLRHYGEFLALQGLHARAATMLERVLELAGSPSYHDLVNAATELRLAGQLARAEPLYASARDLRPHDPVSHANLGAALHLSGRLHEAEASYLRALHLRPGDHVTQLNLARLRSLMDASRGN